MVLLPSRLLLTGVLRDSLSDFRDICCLASNRGVRLLSCWRSSGCLRQKECDSAFKPNLRTGHLCIRFLTQFSAFGNCAPDIWPRQFFFSCRKYACGRIRRNRKVAEPLSASIPPCLELQPHFLQFLAAWQSLTRDTCRLFLIGASLTLVAALMRILLLKETLPKSSQIDFFWIKIENVFCKRA